MTSERWRQIELVFEIVSDCPAEAREARLRQECGDDQDLLREVKGLLDSDADDEQFAHDAVQGAAASLASAASTTLVGRSIGAYRVTRAIGHGGIGAVYEAVRADGQYEHHVAIKLLRGGMGGDADVRRFRRERQLLALLDHPNIARLLDGGATDDGLPYIVMDYVDGRPITEYCREKGLSTEQKLRLFLQLCAATQYAHQRLIVHRDIKPGNVLVTADGIPKLLDFGIARLTKQEPDTGGAHATYTTAWLLTPEYASPEQIRGEMVTAVSDVYSLGVVLYEMLAGQPPHRITSRSATEIERIVCRSEPVPPSVACGKPGLRGDIDNIVLMSLRKEPDRRYTSAEQFAEDIRRYLDGRPVIARKDAIGYRMGKFLKRNRVPVAAGILVAASLIGGVIATLHQARRAERRFDEVRKLAYTMLFDVNDKLAQLPATLEARVLLVDTATRYYDSLARDAEGDEALQWELAQAYSQLAGLQAGHLAVENGGGLGPGLGRSADALISLHKAVDLQERLAARYSRLEYKRPLLMLYYNIGSLQADPNAAIAYMRKGLQLAEMLPLSVKERSGPVSMLLSGLALAQYRAGDPKAALASAKTRPLRPESEGLQPFALAATGDLEGSLAAFQAMVAGVENGLTSLPSGDLRRRIVIRGLAVELAGMADVLGNPLKPNLGRPEQALPHVNRALEIYEQLTQRDARDASFRDDLARAYRTKAALLEDRDPAAAVELCRRAIVSDPGARAQVAQPLRRLGRAQEALDELTKAQAAPLSDADAIMARLALGDQRLAQGDRNAATDEWRQALDIAQKAVAGKPYMMPLRKSLADCYERLGLFEKSLEVWKDWTRWGVSSSYDQNRKRRAEKMLVR
jgi:tRNA A-37 threonylcarbamoyl transferase component Bud32